MKRVISLAAAAFLFVAGAWSFAALAAPQQEGSGYFLMTKPQTYARADGLVLHKASKVPMLVGNGDGYTALGPTYRHTFDGGDGVDIAGCLVPGTQTYTLGGAGAGTTVCNALTPDADCVVAVDAATHAILACSDGAADTASCASPSMLLPVGCSTDTADLEGSSGNILNIYFSDGVVLNWAPIVVQVIAPDMDADGLDIGGDQTDDDGAELFGGPGVEQDVARGQRRRR